MTLPSSRSDAILELGKQLVRELDLVESVDTLARWLAHTLAEKIDRATNGPESERAQRQTEAIDLILQLWARRSDFPRGARPFENLEAIANALARLDPDDAARRFYPPTAPLEVAGAPPKAKVWLDRALQIDSGARSAIRYCLLAADRAATGASSKWADLAADAGLDRDIEIRIVHFVVRLDEAQEDTDEETLSPAAKHLKERVARLRLAAKAIETDIVRAAPSVDPGQL